ncbi:transposase [Segatella copri]|uniref:transposase n=1 Tax=Segatella copri TaxID=165179 RepID=UPI003F705EDB
MAKIQIKSETRHELSFFPNSFDDYVPKDSKVRMVDRIVRSMDINPLMDTYDGIGAPPYSPKMLLSLVVFAYINGVYSCRGIADALNTKFAICGFVEASDCLSRPSTALEPII